MIDKGKYNVLGVMVDAIDYDGGHRQGARRRARAATVRADRARRTRCHDRRRRSGAQRAAEQLRRRDAGRPAGALGPQGAARHRAGRPRLRPDPHAARARDDARPRACRSTSTDRPTKRSASSSPSCRSNSQPSKSRVRNPLSSVRRRPARITRSPNASAPPAPAFSSSASAAPGRRSSRTRCGRCWTCRCSPSGRPSTITPDCCASRRRGCSATRWNGCGDSVWSRRGCGAGI